MQESDGQLEYIEQEQRDFENGSYHINMEMIRQFAEDKEKNMDAWGLK